MALKIFCDICGKEPKDLDFVFEATIMEVRDTFDLTKNITNISPTKQMRKQQIQICKDCYDKNIKKLLKI